MAMRGWTADGLRRSSSSSYGLLCGARASPLGVSSVVSCITTPREPITPNARRRNECNGLDTRRARTRTLEKRARLRDRQGAGRAGDPPSSVALLHDVGQPLARQPADPEARLDQNPPPARFDWAETLISRRRSPPSRYSRDGSDSSKRCPLSVKAQAPCSRPPDSPSKPGPCSIVWAPRVSLDNAGCRPLHDARRVKRPTWRDA